jgi:hypothetical protein
MKMTVLYLKHTGHVLAALTRSATGEAPAASAPEEQRQAYDAAEVAALAGDALLARGFERDAPPNKPLRTQFPIAAADLAPLTVDPDESVLSSPRAWHVAGDPKKLDALSQNWSVIQGVMANTGGDELKVMLAAEVLAKTPVLVYAIGANGEGKRLIDSFQPASPTKQEITFNLQPPIASPRHVLVALAGTRPIVWLL